MLPYALIRFLYAYICFLLICLPNANICYHTLIICLCYTFACRWLIEEFGLMLEESGRWLVPQMASHSSKMESLFLVNHSKNCNIELDHEYIVSDVARLVEITVIKDIPKDGEMLQRYGDERFITHMMPSSALKTPEKLPPSAAASSVSSTPQTTKNSPEVSEPETAGTPENVPSGQPTPSTPKNQSIPDWITLTTQPTQPTQVDTGSSSDDSTDEKTHDYQVCSCYDCHMLNICLSYASTRMPYACDTNLLYAPVCMYMPTMLPYACNTQLNDRVQFRYNGRSGLWLNGVVVALTDDGGIVARVADDARVHAGEDHAIHDLQPKNIKKRRNNQGRHSLRPRGVESPAAGAKNRRANSPPAKAKNTKANSPAAKAKNTNAPAAKATNTNAPAAKAKNTNDNSPPAKKKRIIKSPKPPKKGVKIRARKATVTPRRESPRRSSRIRNSPKANESPRRSSRIRNSQQNVSVRRK